MLVITLRHLLLLPTCSQLTPPPPPGACSRGERHLAEAMQANSRYGSDLEMLKEEAEVLMHELVGCKLELAQVREGLGRDAGQAAGLAVVSLLCDVLAGGRLWQPAGTAALPACCPHPDTWLQLSA